MPQLNLTAAEYETVLELLRQAAQSALPLEDRRAAAAIVNKVTTPHRVVREIVYEGDDASLREQLSRSMPDGLRDAATRITVRTVSSSLSPMEADKGGQS
jgi:hypothetical protein